MTLILLIAALAAAVLFAVLYLLERKRHKETSANELALARVVRRAHEQEVESLKKENEEKLAAAEHIIDRKNAVLSLVEKALTDDDTAPAYLWLKDDELGEVFTASEGLIAPEDLSVRAGDKDITVGDRRLALSRTDADGFTLYIGRDYTAHHLLNEALVANREKDRLTGLYHNEVLSAKLGELFDSYDAPGHACAVYIKTAYAVPAHRSTALGTGEEHIKAMGDAIAACPKGMFARSSRDEFCGLIYGYETPQELEELLQSLNDGLMAAAHKLELAGEDTIRIALGTAQYPADGENIAAVMDNAALSARYAMSRGVYGVTAYSEDDVSGGKSVMAQFPDMTEPGQRKLISTVLQPVVSAASAKTEYYEVQLRSKHPELKTAEELYERALLTGHEREPEQILWFDGLRLFSSLVEKGDLPYNARAIIPAWPGVLLSDKDDGALEEEFYDYLKNLTIVVDDKLTDGPCADIKLKRAKSWGANIAVTANDDHELQEAQLKGTAHLLRVDVRGIAKSKKKQAYFTAAAQHARGEGAKILAINIESGADLKTAISLGADLLQGGYIARGDTKPVDIPEKRLWEIGQAQYGSGR